MARKIRWLGIIVLVIAFSFNGALAMGKLESTQENLVVVPYYDTYSYGYVFAEVTNSGDKPVEFSNGLMELFDADGNSLSSTDLYYCYPPVLQPGETGYVYGYGYVDTASGSQISDFMLSVTGQGTVSSTVTRVEAAARVEAVDDYYGTSDYLVAEVKNTLDAPLANFEIVFAVKDGTGNIVYVISSYFSGYNVSIMPGSSVAFRYQIGSDIATYMQTNGIEPATVDVIAYNLTY